MRPIRLLPLLLIIALSFTGCEVVGAIFEAGFWIGIILVVIIVLIIAWIARKMRR